MREKQWAEKYPGLGTEPVPTEPFISEEHFRLERDRIFRRTWINVGRVEEIPNAGDFFVREIAICSVSILVIRGSDGIVRGFHNVCSHRSNKLILDERGTCRGSVHCNFHNWMYNDKGALIHVPDEENFFNFDKREHGLTPVNTDVWAGFIFVHLDPDPAETLRDYLGGVADQLDGCPFHEMKLMWTYKIEVNANWKVIQDGQNELYHLPFLHRQIVRDAFMRNDKGNCRYQAVNLYNYHSVYSIAYQPSQALTPLRIALSADALQTPIFRIPQMIGKLDHYMVFPNFVIDLAEITRSTACLSYNFWPLAVDRTIWEIRMHFREPVSIRERLRQKYFRRLTLDTLQEDVAAQENVYEGLTSRTKTNMILQDNEVAIRFFHKIVGNYVGSIGGA
ncbi:MAG: aromatic ring-hydroxylating dioxygenase subunit alpha [Nitrospira sp.]|nr:aromatic ring-hydroxylating dioxygenase subunit alpha [Nitrospira sp.]